MLIEPDYIEIISDKLSLKKNQIENTLKLIEEENTVPFIARYRKEVTQNLDEKQIREIIEIKTKEENLYESKVTAIKNIQKSGKLTPQLEKNILNAKTLKEVEDLYAPYKKKRKTKAMIAIEKGFGIIAEQIKKGEKINISNDLLSKYSKDEIIKGAKDIIIQEIADDAKNRQALRHYYLKYGQLESNYKKNLDELTEKTKRDIHKFEIYDNFSNDISKLKSYQILALNRGENLKILNVKLEKDEIPREELEKRMIKSKENEKILKNCIKEGYNKLFTSIETEIRNTLTQKAEDDAIIIFQQNLKNLLMTKPNYSQSILAIDPGYRTGCKIAIIDKENNPKEFSKIYIEKEQETIKTLKFLIEKYNPDTIVIGNGTASNEISEIIKKNLDINPTIVNESGASVYSASGAGAEEFPNLDATDRGTISIGRRYIDPLSELVKIPPHNIGVGMYQHDMNQKELERKLGYVVEDVVNLVGINVNTASIYVLSYISGLNKRAAKKIIENKPYKNRENLKKILAPKTYEQAIGFLRIPKSENPFDNTSIHPEQYELANYIIKNKITINDFEIIKEKLKNIYANVSMQTLIDIIDAYENLGKDPRVFSASLTIDKSVNIEDLKEGDILNGIVRNIMQFGAFVDIGLKNDGLVHISEMANKFVKNPADIVQIGEELKVKIKSVDLEKGKVQLSIKDIS